MLNDAYYFLLGDFSSLVTTAQFALLTFLHCPTLLLQHSNHFNYIYFI